MLASWLGFPRPVISQEKAMSMSDSGRISVYCPCGAKLKIAEEHLGRKAKCPKCAEVFTLEAPPQSDSGTFELSPPDTESDFLSEMAAAAEKAPPAQSAPTTGGVTCVNCNQKHPAEERICVHCGYDCEKGKVVKKVGKLKATDGLLVSISKRLGVFGLGCAFSTAGALVGAGAWFAVAVISQYEIGYIAWGLGLLAGGGMAWGYGDRNAKAGATAALISAGGIVAAKLAIFIYFNAAGISALRADIAQIGTDTQQKLEDGSFELVDHRVEQEGLRNQWYWDDPRRENAYNIHGEAVDQLSEQEIAADLASAKAWNDGERWDDQDYQTNFMIMHYANKAWEEKQEKNGNNDQEGYPSPGKREWRRLVDDARTKVESMEPSELANLAKDTNSKREHETKLAQLTDQNVAIQLVRAGISPEDGEQYEKVMAADKDANKSMTLEEITTAIEENQRWEKSGKWDDPDFLRQDLIYMKTNQVVQDESAEHFEKDDYDWRVSNEKWATYYAQATEEVTPLSDTEVVEATKQIEVEEIARRQAFIDRIQQQVTNRTAKEAMSYFFADYFGGMDLIFGAFAIFTAWGIASGSKEA